MSTTTHAQTPAPAAVGGRRPERAKTPEGEALPHSRESESVPSAPTRSPVTTTHPAPPFHACKGDARRGGEPARGTALATRPVEDPAQLSLIADDLTPLAVEFAEAFRDACRSDASAHDGWVHPSRVSLLLRERFGDFDPRRFSAMWAPACGRNGYLDKTKEPAPIDPNVSKGNGNKNVLLRRWRGWVS